MTTIIMTIVGILLAAAAALMTIFYGGNAFNAGSMAARANTFINGAENINAAITLAKIDQFDWRGIKELSDLHNPNDPQHDYLSEVPKFSDEAFSGLGFLDDPSSPRNGVISYEVYLSSTDHTDELCRLINKKARLPDDYNFDIYGVKYGCMAFDYEGTGKNLTYMFNMNF